MRQIEPIGPAASKITRETVRPAGKAARPRADYSEEALHGACRYRVQDPGRLRPAPVVHPL